MSTHFRQSFVRDLKKVRDRRVLEQVETAITEGDQVEFVRVLHRREVYRHFP